MARFELRPQSLATNNRVHTNSPDLKVAAGAAPREVAPRQPRAELNEHRAAAREVHVEVASGDFDSQAGEGQSHAGLSLGDVQDRTGTHDADAARNNKPEHRDHLASESVNPLLPWFLAVALPCITCGDNDSSKSLI